MSKGHSATIKAGFCAKHEEHCNTCVRCMWLRERDVRNERDAAMRHAGRLETKLADEKALTAELVKVLESVLSDAEHNEMTGGYDVHPQNRALAESVLARAKGGTR